MSKLEDKIMEYEGFIRWVFNRYYYFDYSNFDAYIQAGRIAAFMSIREEKTESQTLRAIRSALGKTYRENKTYWQKTISLPSNEDELRASGKQDIVSWTDPGFDEVEMDKRLIVAIDDAMNSLPDFEPVGDYAINWDLIKPTEVLEAFEDDYLIKPDTEFIREKLENVTFHGLEDLFRFGLHMKDINGLIEEGVLKGAKVTRRLILSMARARRDWLYDNDPRWRKNYVQVCRRNIAKASEEHMRLLREEPGYRAMTLRNLKRAVEQRTLRYYTDSLFHLKLKLILRENMKRAQAALEEKLEDPIFNEHMTQTRRQNIAYGRVVHQERYRNDEGYRRRVKRQFQQNIERGRVVQQEMLLEDPKFRDKKIQIAKANMAKAVKEHRRRLREDPEYRELTRQRLAQGSKVFVEQSLAVTTPRRKQLLNDVIEPHFGGLRLILPTEKIVLTLQDERYSYLRNQYRNGLYAGVRNDIRVLRKEQNVSSIDFNLRRNLLRRMIISKFGSLDRRLPRNEIINLLQTDPEYIDLGRMYVGIRKGVINDLAFLRRSS